VSTDYAFLVSPEAGGCFAAVCCRTVIPLAAADPSRQQLCAQNVAMLIPCLLLMMMVIRLLLRRFITDRIARARPRTPGEEVGQNLILVTPQVSPPQPAALETRNCMPAAPWTAMSCCRWYGCKRATARCGCSVVVSCSARLDTQAAQPQQSA
jgi:hypothetical protein